MTPPGFPPEGLSAPDLTGPVSILNWPISGPRTLRRRRQRPYTHAHLEVDLRGTVDGPSTGVLRRLERALAEREIVDGRNLLSLTGIALHAFSSVGFVRIYHWEAQPGGWLPLPGGAPNATEEPLGVFLKALGNDAWGSVTDARAIAMRLGAKGNLHADVVLRHRHRERRHSITIDLYGLFAEATVRDLVGAIHERLPMRGAKVTKASYAGA